MSDLLTISEVAQILGVSDDTVIRRFAKVRASSTSVLPRRRNVVGIACCESRSPLSRSSC
jgi:hypothetical protein